MRYYVNPKIPKETKEKLTPLDVTLLEKAKRRRTGIDILSLINAGKIYKDEYGSKRWGGTPEILASVRKLVRQGCLLEKGGR